MSSEYLTPYAGSERVRCVPAETKEARRKRALLDKIKEQQKSARTLWEISSALNVPFERVCEAILWDLQQ